MKPVIGQQVIFYPGHSEGPDIVDGKPAEIVHVWSDTCVNLKCADGAAPTSVHFVAAPAPSDDTFGHYCKPLAS